MRCALLLLFVLHGLSLAAPGTLAPFTIKDVSLMLRSGYSISAIESDLASRHFIEAIDPAAEKALLQSGATPALISALKTGLYAVPPQEIARTREEMEGKAQRRALLAEESKKQNTLYQDQLARSRASAPAPGPTGNNTLAAKVKGVLVTSRNGILSPYNDQTLEKKKLIALYFSAHWCPPCRKFTPALVAYYNRIAATHPEFEIVFVSNDRSGPAMEAYMRDTGMPWPAVGYEKIAEKEALQKYAGSGIPCLVLVDAQGKVISDSYAGKTYLGPEKVLADLDRIFAQEAVAVAQSR